MTVRVFVLCAFIVLLAAAALAFGSVVGGWVEGIQ